MIRSAVIDDVPVIAAMVRTLHGFVNVRQQIREPFIEKVITLIIETGFAAVVEIDGEVLGMILATVGVTNISPEPVCFEHAWWVDSSARGNGSELLNRCEEWARERGCKLIKMSSPVGIDGRAHVTLKARGYVETEIVWAKGL